MSFNPENFQAVSALVRWLIVFGGCLGTVLAVALFASLVAKGASGPRAVLRQITGGIGEMLQTSPRRVWALSVLTFRESVRRKALLVFVVFAILFMFAGWFLSQSNDRPDLQAKVYVSFVLTAISWLILPVVLLLSCWGLPEDIKSRTLHTVVTKPVRRHEIVLGRILGFGCVGTLVLLIMGAVGYVWIVRNVGAEAQSRLVARVPIYGQLSFRSREGNPALSGRNVGDIWTFRSYIEGGTKAAAIYEIEGVTPEAMVEVAGLNGILEKKLRLQSRFEAFRTHKGREIDKGLYVRFDYVNPNTQLRVQQRPFELKEFGTIGENTIYIDQKIPYFDEKTKENRDVDLFEELIHDVERTEKDQYGLELTVKKKNVLRVEVSCLDPEQYIGVARPDLFIRTPDRSFWSGYYKSILGIWLMMALIVMLSVTSSCFVKGPVATFLTFTVIVVGQWFHDFMERMVTGQIKQGGVFESIVGLFGHLNPMTKLEESSATTVIHGVDGVANGGLWLVFQIVPDFGSFSRISQYLPNGFDVDFNAALLPAIAVTAAYFLPCILLGYYSLRLRELESK